MALEERRLMHLLSSLIGHSLSPADVGVETDALERSELDMQLLPSKKLYDRLPQLVMVTSYQGPAHLHDRELAAKQILEEYNGSNRLLISGAG
ncbi:hypothetical protein [Lacticaseibacillus brantae]|uniref:hypothetical protein n=1 Tax=Lacticaseibacillus brantae TaxID=943673 RepID=UPI00070D4465|nr:hypothetical protein [Lacticaseibacillus brantae]